MDADTKREILQDKLQTNIANSWKMYSVRFTALFSVVAGGLAGWFLSLPLDCAPLLAKVPPEACTYSQTWLLAKLNVSAAMVPLIAGAVAWWYRVKPQVNLTPEVAAAKAAAPVVDERI